MHSRDGLPHAAAPRADRATRASVLVADDDPEVRASIATALRREGFAVSEARDGLELFEIATAMAREDGAPPDMIVADLRMPRASGLEALADMGPLVRETTILIITAYCDDRTRAEAARLGAIGVMSKPFDLDALHAIARDVIVRRERCS